MKTLVFFLEELSAKEMLLNIVPRLITQTDVAVYYVVFEGKQDLEKRLLKKMQGWLTPDTAFIVLRDQDSADCRTVKQGLLNICAQSGKTDYLVRIACHELEAFYFGDLAAVSVGLGLSNSALQQSKAKYHDPDALINPAEELARLTKDKYQKVAGSRAIAPHLDLEHNLSTSFNVLINGIRRLATGV